ncbi:hypothetical protein F8M41_004317 [Gigaspora margarita]|uniref:Uncharacterized protein n=1 Tax=Gigaspora margarita TaxID=4874 RepID=A0A8H3XBD4_GIGMA|nr:hypothetical protein F8M41_004317 [Gigaspora margarita]
MSSSISYTDLSQKITDCALPKLLKLCYNSQNQLLNELLEEKKRENADIDIPTIHPPKRNKTQSSKLKLSALCSWLPKDYFAKIKANFTPHLEKNQIKESVTWSQLGYTARQSWIEDVYNKHRHQLGSNKWIVGECLKQKLNDRDNEDNLEQDYIVNLEHKDYVNSVSSTYDAFVLSNYTLPTSSSGIISDEYNDPISDNYIGSAPESDSEAIENHTTQNSKSIKLNIKLIYNFLI